MFTIRNRHHLYDAMDQISVSLNVICIYSSVRMILFKNPKTLWLILILDILVPFCFIPQGPDSRNIKVTWNKSSVPNYCTECPARLSSCSLEQSSAGAVKPTGDGEVGAAEYCTCPVPGVVRTFIHRKSVWDHCRSESPLVVIVGTGSGSLSLR